MIAEEVDLLQLNRDLVFENIVDCCVEALYVSTFKPRLQIFYF